MDKSSHVKIFMRQEGKNDHSGIDYLKTSLWKAHGAELSVSRLLKDKINRMSIKWLQKKKNWPTSLSDA